MRFLITGGTGKTAKPLAEQLHREGHKVLVASRSAGNVANAPVKAVIFDWFDSITFENPFPEEESIEGVFLNWPPGATNQMEIMVPFVEYAKSKGVRRFVYLSATASARDSKDPYSKFHEWLATKANVEFAVVRPSWFFQNFLMVQRADMLRDQSQIISATEVGACRWVDTRDIGAAAARALTEEKPHNGDYLIVGPDTFSYDQVAGIFSDELGRTVTHVKCSREELIAHWIQSGIPKNVAPFIYVTDSMFEAELEKKYLSEANSEDIIVGKTSFKEFIRENRAVWAK